ncbi:MAG: hypothetical protein M1834_006455 [Cirrosporium novae-zelandiae]|nr:MAG: hypothetical protein M1834_006455 [Cirrosporium novae-zelandiae]
MSTDTAKPVVQDHEELHFDPESITDAELVVIEKRVIRKCELFVTLPNAIIWMFSFLDRINIGNARIQGLEKDLHMKGRDYNMAIFLLFIPVILFEVPENLLMKRFPPSWVLSILLFGVGIMTIAQGLAQSYGALLACRFVLGIFESGLGPAGKYMISMFYQRAEIASRIGWYLSSALVAGAFAGLLAFAIAHMDGIFGYGGWSWIFIIEGCVTCVVAIIMKFWLPDWLEDKKGKGPYFLTKVERAVLRRRLREDKETHEIGRMDHFDKTAFKYIVSDWKIYVGTMVFFGPSTIAYCLAFFTPTILYQLHWSASTAQVRSIPIYAFAAIFLIFSTHFCKRFNRNCVFYMIGMTFVIIGLIILLCQHHVPVGARYMALYFIVSGIYANLSISMSWLLANCSGHYKRAWAIAFQNCVGNVGGIIAAFIFITSEAPEYPTGYGTCLALGLMSGFSATVYLGGLWWENRRRERGKLDWRIESAGSDNMGDAHPKFRFIY